MNHFTWLFIWCWCWLILSDYVGSSAIYQAPDSHQQSEFKRREKPLFKIPRISSNVGLILTHPWQLSPPMRQNIHHPMYWKANSDEEIFLRHKRKLIQMSKASSMPNDQSEGEKQFEITATDPSVKIESSTTSSFKGAYLNRNFGSNINSIGFRNKFRSSSQTDKTKIVNKFWNAVYNPLPYGAPRSIQTADEADALYRQNQAMGLPVARTASREEKKEEKQELRLPIPDSEIPSPGHYRQPVNESLLQASFNPQFRLKPATQEGETLTSERPVNVEAFRILMEIIKSLRILNPHPDASSSKEEFI